LEWLFFGGPAALMLGIPIVIFIVAVIWTILKMTFDALFGGGGSQ
jgi:hypothetical protein